MIKKFDKAVVDDVIVRLEEKDVKLVCPMCGNRKFELVEGFFRHVVQNNMKTFQVGGKSIPTIVMICKNCGFISQHSLGILGMLE